MRELSQSQLGGRTVQPKSALEEDLEGSFPILMPGAVDFEAPACLASTPLRPCPLCAQHAQLDIGHLSGGKLNFQIVLPTEMGCSNGQPSDGKQPVKVTSRYSRCFSVQQFHHAQDMHPSGYPLQQP